jgi:hypothetical protein
MVASSVSAVANKDELPWKARLDERTSTRIKFNKEPFNLSPEMFEISKRHFDPLGISTSVVSDFETTATSCAIWRSEDQIVRLCRTRFFNHVVKTYRRSEKSQACLGFVMGFICLEKTCCIWDGSFFRFCRDLVEVSNIVQTSVLNEILGA